MNSLSVFLYLCEVVANLGFFLTIVGCMLVVVVLICAICYTESYGDDALDWMKRGKMFAVLSLVTLSVAMLFPSKETLYAIAASEIGEQAIQTPEFIKARKMLNKYLDEQISEENTNEED